MGWWSANVMGGDTPYDLRGAFEEKLGFASSFFDRMQDSGLTKKGMKMMRDRYNERLADIIDWIEKKWSKMTHVDDVNIAYQVLAVQMMEVGADMPDWLRGRCIEAAIGDEWSKQQLEEGGKTDRFDAMISLIDDILSYVDGKPTELSSPDMGLMGTIFSHMAKGEKGLVNR